MKILIKQIGYSFLILSSGTLLNYLLQLTLAKLMGTTVFGIYTYIYTWLLVILLIPKMGFDTALLRFMPDYQSRGQWPAFRGIVKLSTTFTTTLAILIAAIAISAASRLSDVLSGDTQTMLYLFSIALLPMVLIRIYQAQLQAIKHPVLAMFIVSMAVPVIHLLFVIIYYCLSGTLNGKAAALGLLLSAVSTCLYLRYRLNREFHQIGVGSAMEFHWRYWFGTIWPLALSSATIFLIGRIDILLLGLFKNPDTVAIYSVSSLIALTITFVLQANNTVIIPHVSDHFHAGNKVQLQEKLKTSMLYMGFFTIALYILILLAASTILNWFGEDYQRGIYVIIILSTAQLFNALCGPVGFIMNVTKYQRQALTILYRILILGLLLNLLFIPAMGMEGAAAATASTIIVWNLWMLMFIKRQIGVDPSIMNLLRR